MALFHFHIFIDLVFFQLGPLVFTPDMHRVDGRPGLSVLDTIPYFGSTA